MERWLSNFAVTDAERQLIFSYNKNTQFDLPKVRASIFPFAERFYTPIKWIDFRVEALLLSVIYGFRAVFRWAGVAFWFSLRIILYSVIERMALWVFGVVDMLILLVLPGWVPPFMMAGMGTVVGVSALQSYLYSIGFSECLKSILLARVGLWALMSLWLKPRRRR
jgi:hypothetical protein